MMVVVVAAVLVFAIVVGLVVRRRRARQAEKQSTMYTRGGQGGVSTANPVFNVGLTSVTVPPVAHADDNDDTAFDGTDNGYEYEIPVSLADTRGRDALNKGAGDGGRGRGAGRGRGRGNGGRSQANASAPPTVYVAHPTTGPANSPASPTVYVAPAASGHTNTTAAPKFYGPASTSSSPGRGRGRGGKGGGGGRAQRTRPAVTLDESNYVANGAGEPSSGGATAAIYATPDDNDYLRVEGASAP